MTQEKKNLWQRMPKKEKIFMVVAILIMLSNLFYYEFYKGNARNVTYKAYSKIYTKEDVTHAVELVRADFKDNYNGCKMEKVEYNDNNMKKFENKIKNQDKYKDKEIIILNVDFRARNMQAILKDKLKANQKVKNAYWILARENKNAPWKIIEKEY
ncbi:hypothetical protein [Peptostreptococcus equinus]|uniref:DUF4829 domain-containing protein n=1 Tax=Peptostreptococcus equinus TaxID=3003601 RepID=A0ABY7JN74_9FIRM|nr:hypothetical protein [Peptostreptococcus sp. CBA3647]WAW14830.1 hypothetical protein O0R46_09635 [Peptostreptococcus sp. CBA3647]